MAFNTLDHAVSCLGGDQYIVAHHLHRLVVEAVDPEVFHLHDLPQLRTRLNVNFMTRVPARRLLVVPECPFHLGTDILVKAATRGHVENLYSPAYPEHRHPVPQGPAGQFYFQPVPLRLDFAQGRKRLLPKVGGIDVVAPW